MSWREGERGGGGGEGGGEVHAVLPDRLWRMCWFCGPLTVCVSVSVCLSVLVFYVCTMFLLPVDMT